MPSDRGIQYASADFREVLNRHGFIQSMSRKGKGREDVRQKILLLKKIP
jgi:hypothetical protein